jgi:hypothetical protein
MKHAIAYIAAEGADRDRGATSPALLAGIEKLKGSNVPHAGCVRAFLRLWDENSVVAKQGYEACRLYGFDPTAAPPKL